MCSVEIASAIGRKVRDADVGQRLGMRTWALFQQHWLSQYEVLLCNDAILEYAEQLVFKYSLRAMDAVHVATALEHRRISRHERIEFWTADVQQARAAGAEGLTARLVS
jgi:predicted nucleic acid-binding protein